MKKIGLLLILLLVITSCGSAGTNSEEIWECIVVETTPAQVNENYYRFTTEVALYPSLVGSVIVLPTFTVFQ